MSDEPCTFCGGKVAMDKRAAKIDMVCNIIPKPKAKWSHISTCKECGLTYEIVSGR